MFSTLIAVLFTILKYRNLSNQSGRSLILFYDETPRYKSAVLCFMRESSCDISGKNLVKENEICRTPFSPYYTGMEETIHKLRGKCNFKFR